jgi:hypothetical protein
MISYPALMSMRELNQKSVLLGTTGATSVRQFSFGKGFLLFLVYFNIDLIVADCVDHIF